MLINNSYTKAQSGVVLLSVVSILLTLATLSIWISSQRIVGEIRMLNSRFSHQQAYADLNQKMQNLVQQIQLTGDGQLKANHPQSTIHRQIFTASNGTLVYRYNIHLTVSSPSISIYRAYLRYSGLFSLPDRAITENDKDITERLLNRSIDVLSAADFTGSEVVQSCQENISATVVWIEGDCHIGNQQTLGRAKAPKLLIVKNGSFTLGLNSTLHGLVILVTNSGPPKRLTINHSSKVIGAIMSNHPLIMQLNGNVTYDLTLLQQLQTTAAIHRVIPVRGSWHDFK
jgi:hypothetical protein